VFGVSFISDLRGNRVAVLQSVQAAARLRCRVQIGRRKREAVKAERVRRIGFLRRNHAAPWPLSAAVRAGKSYRADDAVAVDDRGPHLEVKAARLFGDRGDQRRLEFRLGRQARARIVTRSRCRQGSAQGEGGEHSKLLRNQLVSPGVSNGWKD
jgi:hypothetical protein